MKILSSLLVAASFFCLIGCAETAENDETITTTEMDDIDNTELYDPETSEPGTDMGQMQTMDTDDQSQTADRLNPAHGTPGHRCDIEVGAPLDSPTGQAAQPAGAQPQVEFQQQENTNSSAKINPAHGQPGHDCSVTVGAPLN